VSVQNFEIQVRPQASALAVGGQSAPRLGGDKATARDHRDRPVIPASTLRGALRLELERLLRARGEVVCSANRPETDVPLPPCACPVCRLFGEQGGATGTLRLEDAVIDAVEDLRQPALRPGVAVGRRGGTAVSGHLVLFETTGSLNMPGAAEVSFRASGRLVPRGSADTAATVAEDLANLQAACAALEGLGGGKARGLGWVACSLIAKPADGRSGRSAAPPPSAGLTVRFTALAPLHFGLGRPVGAFQPTLRYAPGSTVRGALAYALLEQGVSGDDVAFQRLFGPPAEVSFGAARPAGDVPSATRRRCRPGDHVFDDLVGELLRRRAAAAGVALAVAARGGCPRAGCEASKLLTAPHRAGSERPEVRVRTRNAINRQTGTAMDRKLFSIEAVEPQLPGGRGLQGPRLVLTAEVWAADPRDLALLLALDGGEVWLGGKRSRGMGRCEVAVAPVAAPETSKARAAIQMLAAELESSWRSLRAVAAELDGPALPAGCQPLALVLDEPWTPGGEDVEAQLRRGPLGTEGMDLWDAFVVLTEEGRFGANEADRFGAPAEVPRGEVPPERAAAAGSVYVYAVPEPLLDERLTTWLTAGRRGSGRHAGLGWGRFTVRGPETDF
jgi:CRISPR/Cas system CSM-associated protein Csm3 (group 7 of RAMP superfamily)